MGTNSKENVGLCWTLMPPKLSILPRPSSLTILITTDSQNFQRKKESRARASCHSNIGISASLATDRKPIPRRKPWAAAAGNPKLPDVIFSVQWGQFLNSFGILFPSTSCCFHRSWGGNSCSGWERIKGDKDGVEDSGGAWGLGFIGFNCPSSSG